MQTSHLGVELPSEKFFGFHKQKEREFFPRFVFRRGSRTGLTLFVRYPFFQTCYAKTVFLQRFEIDLEWTMKRNCLFAVVFARTHLYFYFRFGHIFGDSSVLYFAFLVKFPITFFRNSESGMIHNQENFSASLQNAFTFAKNPGNVFNVLYCQNYHYFVDGAIFDLSEAVRGRYEI